MGYRVHAQQASQKTIKQQTLAMAAVQGAGFETRRKRTRCDEFHDTINTIMPWPELCAVVEPYNVFPPS
jgi:IS5 family transposase